MEGLKALSAKLIPTLYDWAGGTEALEKLTRVF
jgi:hypothetical protein